MADNIVSFLLSVNDTVSPVLARLRGNFRETEQTYRDAQGRLRQANGRFLSEGTAGFLQMGNLWDKLVSGFSVGAGFAAFDVAIGQIGNLRDAFWQAAQAQTQLIASSSDVGANLGVGIKAARDVVEDIQTRLSKVAADLPGETKDYGDVFLGASGTLAKVFAGDTEGFKAASEDIVKRIGVLGAIRQIPGIASGQTLDRFISGTTGFGELRQLDLFQKNRSLVDAIQQVAGSQGLDVSNLKEWTTKQRFDVISQASKIATPDSLIAEFKGTAESIIQGWRSGLFDPLTGLFGLMRRIPNLANRSALDSFSNLLTQIDIFVKSLGGLSFDPMAELIKFFDWLSYSVAKLTSLRQQGVDLFDIGKIIEFSRSIGDTFPGYINAALQWLKQTLDSIDWVQTGRAFARYVGDSLIWLRNWLLDINWGDVANILVSGVSAVLKFTWGIVEEGFKGILDTFKGWIEGLKGIFADPIGFIKGLISPAPTVADPGASGSIFSPDSSVLPLPQVATPSTSGGSFLFNPQVSVQANPGQDANAIAEQVAGRINDKFDEYRRAWAF